MHDSRRSANLATLEPGETGHLVDYGAMSDDTVRRFKALGFTPGREIHCIRRATFGCPIEFEVLGTHIAMRATDAREIRVLDPFPSDS